MPKTNQTFIVPQPTGNSIEQLRAWGERLVKEIDRQHRLNRADVHALEVTAADHEARITALEP